MLFKIYKLIGTEKKRLPFLLVLCLISSSLDLAGLGLITPFLGTILNPKPFETFDISITSSMIFSLEKDSLIAFFGITILIIIFLKFVSITFINWKITSFSENQRVRLGSALMGNYQSMDYQVYLHRNSSEYVYTIQTLVQEFANTLFSILKIATEGIVALVILAFLIWKDPIGLGMLLFLVILTLTIFDAIFKSQLQSYGEIANTEMTKTVRSVNEGIFGLKEIRILGKEYFFKSLVKTSLTRFAAVSTKQKVISGVPRYLLEFLMALFLVSFILYSMFVRKDLTETIPTLGVFMFAALRLFPSVSVISNSIIHLRYAKDGISRLYSDYLQLDPQAASNSNKLFEEISLKKNTLYSDFKRLNLRNVFFTYSQGKKMALDNVSLELKSGDCIGFMGTSGSGKTTLLDIILGFLKPDKGQILYNGLDLTSKLEQWQNQVAYLPQEVLLIDATLKKNVALGTEEKFIDTKKVEDAIKKAQLEGFVKDLPDGFDTMLGERGARISGGQKQRVALARAFYYNRNILILDEASSALDQSTETQIISEIKKLKGSVTLIIIAHRLNTLRICDKIYELKNGRIVKSGHYLDMVK